MKQIKTFTLALAAALLLLAAGCTDERDNGGTGNIAPGTPVEINFDAPTVANNGTATRAATTVPLPANTTVRITPYNKTKSRYESSLTYYVGTPADGKGKLIPYTAQNADGTFVAGTKMKVIMGDTYQFYISTPAKDITSEGYKQTVGNNEDYASAVSGDCIVTGGFVSNAFCFPPPTLVRRCAQITVELMTASSMQIASAPGGVRLSGLRSAQAGIAPGAAIPTTGGTYDQSYTVTTLQSENVGKLLYNSFCVLPGVSTATITAQLVAILKPDGVNEVRKTVTYSAKLNFVEPLKPGYRYQVRLVAETENAEVLPTVTVTDWDITGGDLKPDPSNHYPYVTTNAEGEMCVVVFQDVHGGVLNDPLTKLFIHDPWLQTPTHLWTSTTVAGIARSFSRLEVANSNSPIGAAAWGSTNNGCTAPWRRPTLYEGLRIRELATRDAFPGIDPLDGDYWTATEVNAEKATSFSNQTLLKSSNLRTRCVRDIEFAPVSSQYPYVVGGKYVVFSDLNGHVGLDPKYTWHEKWTQSLYSQTGTDADEYGNMVFKGTIEVSDVVHPPSRWMTTNGPCISPWRTPTCPELVMIFQVSNYLNIPIPPNSSLWTSKNDGEDIGYVGFFVTNSGGIIELTAEHSDREAWTRCVRDL